MWPDQTETARSMYIIDDGQPTEFLPQGLQETSRLQFYDSGMLPEGEHTLKITNLAPFLYLDFFELDGANVASSSAAPGGSGTSALATTTSPPPSTTTTANDGESISSDPTNPKIATPSQLSTAISFSTSSPPHPGVATSRVHSHGITRAALIGLIVVTIVIALFALVLLHLRCQYLRRTRSRLRAPHPCESSPGATTRV